MSDWVMRRIISIAILLLYTALSVGMVVSTHYCKGKLVAVKVSFGGDGKCSCKGGKMKKSCCSKNTVYLKIGGEQKSVSSFACPNRNFYEQVIVLPPTKSLFCVNLSELAFNDADIYPPKVVQQPIYLLDRVFLI